ncbi:aspartate aminotransferase family protein, partial [Rhizobium sp. BR5]
DHELVGEAVNVGLMGGLQLTADKTTRRRFAKPDDIGTAVRNHCLANGLVMRATGDRMLASPALTISRSEVDQIIETLRKALDYLRDTREHF